MKSYVHSEDDVIKIKQNSENNEYKNDNMIYLS